jgi:hypothetical protein
MIVISKSYPIASKVEKHLLKKRLRFYKINFQLMVKNAHLMGEIGLTSPARSPTARAVKKR